jgi:hypothetical protein
MTTAVCGLFSMEEEKEGMAGEQPKQTGAILIWRNENG